MDLKLWRHLLIALLALTVGVAPFATPATARSSSGASGTWKAFLSDREDLMEELAPAFVSCYKRRDSLIDPASPIFHGCLDWHSAVHAAYSHHVMYRRTGDKSYLELAQDQIAPNGVSLVPAEEIYTIAKAPDYELSENPYGFGWFLVMAREREQSTKRKDFRPLANFAADQMIGWFEQRRERGDAPTYILNRAHPNYSWSLINLDVWARYTGDKKILSATKAAAKPLLDKTFDDQCPVTLDQNEDASGFQPACLMRLAAVAHVFGDAKRDWVSSRLPKDYSIDPVKNPSGCHAGGLNFTRAFALFQMYRITGNTSYRDNYAELIRYHVGRPELYMGEQYFGNPDYMCYSHWVAQMGVRAISLSYE